MLVALGQVTQQSHGTARMPVPGVVSYKSEQVLRKVKQTFLNGVYALEDDFQEAPFFSPGPKLLYQIIVSSTGLIWSIAEIATG